MLVWAFLGAARAEPIDIEAQLVPLSAEDRALDRVGSLRFYGGLRLRSDDSRFGGLSGLSVSADGARLVAVSDRGDWFTADLVYDAAGRLARIANAALVALRDTDGGLLASKPWRDAEAVERLPDGGYVVSFERRHRLWRYAGPDEGQAAAQPTVDLPGLSEAPGNGGIEAIAVLPAGRLLAVSEGAAVGKDRLLGWLVDGNRVEPLSYVRNERFRPTDFAALPSGDVIALERRFTPPAGIAARIQIIDAGTIRAGAALDGREIARLIPPLTVDNMEGIAVVTASDGGTLIYLLSDDNFNPLQLNLLLMFRLEP